MKVKKAIFFYNTNLLNSICAEETDFFMTESNIAKEVNVGDSIKLINEQKSCIVEIVDIGEKDCNGLYGITIKLLKVVKGELEIEY